jgi:hypothetical protein
MYVGHQPASEVCTVIVRSGWHGLLTPFLDGQAVFDAPCSALPYQGAGEGTTRTQACAADGR